MGRSQASLSRDAAHLNAGYGVLKTSRLHRFKDIKNVNSAIRGQLDEQRDVRSVAVHCWVFERNKAARA